jgi:hypothetical protein
MEPTEALVNGHLLPDGSLQLDQKVPLPPGPVKVMVRVAEGEEAKEDTWSVLERIWAERGARGMPARTRGEIDAEIDGLRNEWDERQRELERIPCGARIQTSGCFALSGGN